MFIKTKRFMGELDKVDCLYVEQDADGFILYAAIADEGYEVTKKETEQELNDFMEALADAIENGLTVFRE